MSWKAAQRDAERWIEACKLGKTSGQAIDLRPHAALLEAQGAFRGMVLEAARRLLAKRGATAVILPD